MMTAILFGFFFLSFPPPSLLVRAGAHVCVPVSVTVTDVRCVDSLGGDALYACCCFMLTTTKF